MQRHFAIRLLHWCMVLCVASAYGSAYYRQNYTSQTESSNWYLLIVHMNIGLLIFLISFLMLFYHFSSAPKPSLKSRMAVTMHRLLYLLLIALPISAYIGTGFDFPLLGLVPLDGFTRFAYVNQFIQENFQILTITFIEPFARFHKLYGSYFILPILLAGHIGAAILQYSTGKKRK